MRSRNTWNAETTKIKVQQQTLGFINKITRPTNCACSEIKTKDQLLAIEEHELETSKAGLVDSTSAVPAESP